MLTDAYGLIEHNELLLLIYTDGRHLELDEAARTGSTGWWRMAARRHPDKVVIYHRHPDRQGGDIYLANYAGKQRRSSDGRWRIEFSRWRHLGTTSSTWSEYANQGKPLQSPLRYIQSTP